MLLASRLNHPLTLARHPVGYIAHQALSNFGVEATQAGFSEVSKLQNEAKTTKTWALPKNASE